MDKQWWIDRGYDEVYEVKDIRYDKIVCDFNYSIITDKKPTYYFERLKGTDKEMTIKKMLEWMKWIYLQVEEYEKCTVIQGVLDHPNNQKHFK